MSGGCRGEISIYDDAESRRSGTKGAMKEQSIWASRGPDITVNENAEVTAGDVVDVEGDGRAPAVGKPQVLAGPTCPLIFS